MCGRPASQPPTPPQRWGYVARSIVFNKGTRAVTTTKPPFGGEWGGLLARICNPCVSAPRHRSRGFAIRASPLPAAARADLQSVRPR
jgi:hypothetical protein